MRYICTVFIAFLCINNCWSKELSFGFDYPDSISKNADAVVLLDETTYTRTSKSNLKQEIHFVITILSERADNQANFVLYYDKFSSISNLECIIYDAKGTKVRKVKSSEIRDYSAYDGFSLFSDNRVKQFTALNPTYPYTIELSYTTNYDGFLGIPTWTALNGYRVGVKKAILTLNYPQNLAVNYKEKHTDQVHRIESTLNNTTSVSWTAENLIAIDYERFSPELSEQLPMVLFSPKEFLYDKSEGSFDSWQSLGKWNYGLFENNYVLNNKTKQELDRLKNSLTDKHKLVKGIYNYMQSKTRYVSIQLGIGGFKPFSPQLVDEVGYGDCKALSYYTKSLLDYLGIESYYAVIGVNSRKIEFPDFPSINQMNHAILCVPINNDTIWLECTSQTAPFNYLFSGSAGRNALLITAEGGKIVRTCNPTENRKSNIAAVKIDSKGEILCDITTNCTGAFYDEDFGKLQLSNKELRELVLNESPVSDISIINTNVIHKEQVPEIAVNKKFTTRSMVTKSGNRLFVELSPFMSLQRIVPQKNERRNPIFLEETIVYHDSIMLELPIGQVIEFCPEGKQIESEYGNYYSKITSENGKVTFNRTLTINKACYPKENYIDFIGFVNSAAEADKCKIILKSL